MLTRPPAGGTHVFVCAPAAGLVSALRCAVGGAVVALLLLASSVDAATQRMACGTTTAAGKTMKVRLYNEWGTGFKSLSCETARGILRKFARIRPTPSSPTATLRYRGRRWSCYLSRERRGYNCSPDGRSYRVPYTRGTFG